MMISGLIVFRVSELAFIYVFCCVGGCVMGTLVCWVLRGVLLCPCLGFLICANFVCLIVVCVVVFVLITDDLLGGFG